MQLQHNAAAGFAAEIERHCVGSRIGRLHRIVARRYELALAPAGLTPPQLEILAALTVADRAVSPSVLAHLLAVERSTMSRNLALMRERGLVDAADRSPTGRVMTVAVTDAGREAFAQARTAWRNAQESVLDALGQAAPEALDGWLSSLGLTGPAA
jgi:DNA-binding MarR family transcriptional regulator